MYASSGRDRGRGSKGSSSFASRNSRSPSAAGSLSGSAYADSLDRRSSMNTRGHRKSNSRISRQQLEVASSEDEYEQMYNDHSRQGRVNSVLQKAGLDPIRLQSQGSRSLVASNSMSNTRLSEVGLSDDRDKRMVADRYSVSSDGEGSYDDGDSYDQYDDGSQSEDDPMPPRRRVGSSTGNSADFDGRSRKRLENGSSNVSRTSSRAGSSSLSGRPSSSQMPDRRDPRRTSSARYSDDESADDDSEYSRDGYSERSGSGESEQLERRDYGDDHQNSEYSDEDDRYNSGSASDDENLHRGRGYGSNQRLDRSRSSTGRNSRAGSRSRSRAGSESEDDVQSPTGRLGRVPSLRARNSLVRANSIMVSDTRTLPPRDYPVRVKDVGLQAGGSYGDIPMAFDEIERVVDLKSPFGMRNVDGLGESAVLQRKQQQSILRRGSTMAGDLLRRLRGRVALGEEVTSQHRSYNVVRVLTSGIRGTVAKQKRLDDGPVTNEDFLVQTKHELAASSSLFGTLEFKDYCPGVFKSLRHIFGIDDADYLESICGSPLSQLGTPGKSGQLFYFTQDGRYIIKTVTKDESKFLREFLVNYYRHVSKHNDSLLCRFLGMHRVSTPGQLHFVVMANIFDTDRVIHERYDLKGSTQGRASSLDSLDDPLHIFKDLDFLNRDRRIALGPGNKKKLLSQLRSDVRMLSMLGIMDYSFLLGIHNREHKDSLPSANGAPAIMRRTSSQSAGNPSRSSGRRSSISAIPEASHTSGFQRHDGGIVSCDEYGRENGQEIYFFGIIDILQLYNLKKKSESALKGFIHNTYEISAVDPAFYAERFIRFMDSIID